MWMDRDARRKERRIVSIDAGGEWPEPLARRPDTGV
jgi:hypothetical protein